MTECAVEDMVEVGASYHGHLWPYMTAFVHTFMQSD